MMPGHGQDWEPDLCSTVMIHNNLSCAELLQLCLDDKMLCLISLIPLKSAVVVRHVLLTANNYFSIHLYNVL